MMENQQIYQIQIALRNVKPKIWRRVLIPSDMPLGDLHKVIQTAMGWFNCHLHQFIKGGNSYGTPSDEDDYIDFDYSGLNVSDLLVNEKDKIVYEYDFGDGWEHNVVLEKIVPAEPGREYPVCVAGKNSCPPEDCGGPWGYTDMLASIADTESEGREEFIEWLGEDFEPGYFDKNEVNERLLDEDYGCSDDY